MISIINNKMKEFHKKIWDSKLSMRNKISGKIRYAMMSLPQNNFLIIILILS